MRLNRRIVAFLAVMAVLAAACGGDGGGDSSAAEPVAVDQLELSGPAAEGRDLFKGKCATCHKADMTGAAGPALGPGSRAAGKNVDQLRTTIQRGATGMPAWAGILTDEEIEAVVAFLGAAQGR